MDRPAFEIRHLDGRSIRIFANGAVEGAPEGFTIVFNRIPAHVAEAVVADRAMRQGAHP